MNLQNYYDTVMQLSHGIVVTLDLDGLVVHGNAELEQLSGYSMQELAGRDWFETFIPEDERDAARKAVLERAHDQGVSAMAGAIRDRDGDFIYIHWHLKPLADSKGEVISILCVGQDVTGHMLRENGLLRERFTLMERNKELNCLYEISQLMGDMEPPLGVLLQRVVQVLSNGFQHPEKTHVRLRVDNEIWETSSFLATDHVISEPVMVHREKRGELAVFAESGHKAPFIDDELDLLATAVQQVALIVAKKESRESKLALEAQLRQADRLAKIGQFSAGVAHEINEPLANILGFAELALQTPNLPEQVKSDLGSIVDSSLHAREVIRKLMFFSRQMPPQLLEVDFNEVVEQAISITETGAKRSNVEIVRDFDSALPRLHADPQHLKQVVINLVANSIQAMPDGGRITVQTISDGSDAYIIVEDTGPGMEPEVLKQIFNPFYTTKDVDQGTGLGLSVVHGIIKAHDGFIQVHSKPGEGTRVEVAFPCPKDGILCSEGVS
ncbi:ATP-binding protein [Pseudodesulfovibrio sp. zrk46]|uniref:PAS domain-containing sensor histidine kinase n=1 Tax=Pseudodesulfovibrio sp. zrk46 TaxID=2725288 RepID=UPI001449092D|nr:ATP-binding protein [Pseudodesulfovibrio sp. zrk46]QJB57455.1 PAS domain S-box protein [Pseudodesulfovibrio sp. zrk46]